MHIVLDVESIRKSHTVINNKVYDKVYEKKSQGPSSQACTVLKTSDIVK